jgi:hypothetical protein
MSSWVTHSVNYDSDHHLNFEGDPIGGNACERLLPTEEPESFSSAHGTYSDR